MCFSSFSISLQKSINKFRICSRVRKRKRDSINGVYDRADLLIERAGGLNTTRGQRIARIAERYTDNIYNYLTKKGENTNPKSEVTEVGRRIYMGLSNG